MITVLQGDWIEQLRTLPDSSVQCCVTSPPYWGLRDYGVAGQLGLEKTPEEYVAKMVEGFREVRRVLRDDGTLWLNLGSSYWGGKGQSNYAFQERRESKSINGDEHNITGMGETRPQDGIHPYFKPKDLVPIPWMVAMAMQQDGWFLRCDIVWAKPNPMPESVTDRPTKSHEYIFLMSKSQRYFYDAEAIKEAVAETSIERAQYNFDSARERMNQAAPGAGKNMRNDQLVPLNGLRNKRTVWTVPSQAYSEAHFATFPEDLIKPCILAGTKPGDTVLDPFGGSGTTGQVALELGRNAILIELNPEYVKLIERRTDVTPGLAIA